MNKTIPSNGLEIIVKAGKPIGCQLGNVESIDHVGQVLQSLYDSNEAKKLLSNPLMIRRFVMAQYTGDSERIDDLLEEIDMHILRMDNCLEREEKRLRNAIINEALNGD